MPITAYTGLPRNGKSYGVVENVIIPALKNKRRVFSNIPMNTENCIEKFGLSVVPFETQDIIDNDNWFNEVFESGALIVIDELWRLWPAGLKVNNARSGDKEFLAEHGHLVGDDGLCTEVILVTQDLAQVASFVKLLVETTYLVTKLSKIGMENKYRVDVFHGQITGCSPPQSKIVKQIFGKFKKETFALYVSHTKSKTGQAGNESLQDSRFNVLKGWKIQLGVGVFVLLCIGVYLGISSVTSNGLVPSMKKAHASTIPQNVISAPMVYPIPKKKFSHFLARSQGLEIIYNLGKFPTIQYIFRINFPDHYVDINPRKLKTFGYVIKPIDQCLVQIQNDSFTVYAACKPASQDKTFFSNLMTTES